ncbi:MAG TPA: universal stress protein [Polyangiaceae bacterium]
MIIEKILVPVDYSECSRAALAKATEFAESFGAKLDVVHVWDRPTYVSDSLMVASPSGEKRSLIEMIRENAAQEMVDFIRTVKVPATVALSHRLLSGEPVSTLLRDLKEHQHDLVVVGTHGRTGLTHVLVGSVAERLVRSSPVPVVTVPPPR